ncbi:MAG: nitroreductase [Saprospiraceae bacterium]|nr:nitroreductase [Saprospiraceae bacterium]
MQPESIHEIIRSRRAVFPPAYNGQPITRELIGQVLENANWAPTHKRTEPWRFKVFTGNALERLGAYLANVYKMNTPAEQFSDVKYNKMLKNPTRAGCVIAVCMERDPAQSLPEWEEIAAVACAVQNMWLTCTALGIASYWSTPGAILKADEFLGLKAGERCLGLFYMGYSDAPAPEGTRRPIAEKTQWISE